MQNCKLSVVNELKGTINPIPSKSTIHRSLICALLVRGKTKITNIIESDDVIATLSILQKCGVVITKMNNGYLIDSTEIKNPGQVWVNESGSTLRFILPVLLYLFGEADINASRALQKRPHDVFNDILKQSEITNYKLQFPLKITGELKNNDYEIVGNISSQFISGLLFVLPLLPNDSTISFTTPIESKGYIDLTIAVLKVFGIEIMWEEERIIIKGKQKYQKSITYENEIDASNLAYWLSLEKWYPKINIENKNFKTFQPDNVFTDLIQTKNEKISVAQCPDLLPILATHFSLSGQNKILIDTKRTKIKESNRLMAITNRIKQFGYAIIINDRDELIIGSRNKTGCENIIEVDGANDHRIIMSIAIMAIVLKQPIIINGCDAVAKSDPYFWQKLKAIGVDVQEVKKSETKKKNFSS